MTPELSSASKRAIQVLKADGKVLSGGRACLFILEELGWGWGVRLLVHRPFIWAIELGYRIVALHRPFFSRIFTFLTSRKRKPLEGSYWLARILFLRFLGLIYLVAFFSLANQLGPLIGENGLYPASQYLERVEQQQADGSPYLALPTLFWIHHSDSFLSAMSYAGVVLSLVLLSGFAHAILLFFLWVLYLSFVNIGQLFYGYGWEILLLETGFLAIFLFPIFKGNPFPQRSPPPVVVMWLYRWLLFRVIFGAGMIKIRGDACWWELTCLNHHYETQPIPNPLSWYLHQMPASIHALGVLWTHFVELIAPWMVFGPRLVRHTGAVLIGAFQVMLILSGNLSWLNWLTLAICIPCFDDRFLKRFFPQASARRIGEIKSPENKPRARTLALALLVMTVLWLSYDPVVNLVSPRQAMNRSFDPLRLVNTYGAFGSVGRTRHELIVFGTDDTRPGERTEWREYEFKCKPGDPARRPCVVSPYHYRLDWQIWFAAMPFYRSSNTPWLVHLLAKLLQGDPGAISLIEKNPFPKNPPRYIRVDLYEYKFTTFADPSGAWWKRRRVGSVVRPLSLDDPALKEYLQRRGWK